MYRPTVRGVVVSLVFLACGSALAAGLAGSWVEEEEPTLTLTVKESPDGKISGSLGDDGETMALAAHREGTGFRGTVGSGNEALPIRASLQGDSLVVDIGTGEDAEHLVFRRSGAAPHVVAKLGGRSVIINGVRLTDEEVARAEQTYRVRIPDADYWYDPVLGAWGVRGSPTLGFIAPGLALGGRLQPDASGPGTGVFVNGRNIPQRDLAALQSITGPIAPGRYFIDATGWAGYEGGPPQWNLGAMAAQARGGGGSTSWQSRFSSGISDGETIGVFLPNGGIVSTGP